MNRMFPHWCLLAIAGIAGSAAVAAASSWRVEPCKWKDGPFQMEGSLDFPKQEFPKLERLSQPEKDLEHQKPDQEEHATKDSHRRHRPHGNPMLEHRHERQHIYHQVYKPPKADE